MTRARIIRANLLARGITHLRPTANYNYPSWHRDSLRFLSPRCLFAFSRTARAAVRASSRGISLFATRPTSGQLSAVYWRSLVTRALVPSQRTGLHCSYLRECTRLLKLTRSSGFDRAPLPPSPPRKDVRRRDERRNVQARRKRSWIEFALNEFDVHSDPMGSEARFSLRTSITWHVLSRVDRFDPGSQRRPPGAFCARDVRSPRSRDGHLRVVCAAWPVPYPSSCWSQTVQEIIKLKFPWNLRKRGETKISFRWLTWDSAPPSASSRRSDSWMTCTLKSARSRSICNVTKLHDGKLHSFRLDTNEFLSLVSAM